MHKGRLEAFSDGVLAIIITIMVLELKAPHGIEISDLAPLTGVFLSYVLSFIYVGIYWSNHHHLFQAAREIDGRVMWANLHLLFWLSMIPFVTAWSGENHFAPVPVAMYGIVLMLCGFAYSILTRTLLKLHGSSSILSKALGNDFKGKISVVLYALAIAVAYWLPLVACLVYVGVAILWIVPDKRIEKVLPHVS